MYRNGLVAGTANLFGINMSPNLIKIKAFSPIIIPLIIKLWFANEINVLIERYKNIETKLIDTKCDRNNTINFKETPYRSTLRDPQGKAEPAIGNVLAIPEELETVILSDKAYAMGFLKC
ncbi:hypothetical protein H8356DRAFT_1426837 [Neocallimastix lanati (nom. inval.)]|nr:hypothetical protein H8356DRAFT_1426837 [Neocallimastix sp. JGI-2020a]